MIFTVRGVFKSFAFFLVNRFFFLRLYVSFLGNTGWSFVHMMRVWALYCAVSLLFVPFHCCRDVCTLNTAVYCTGACENSEDVRVESVRIVFRMVHETRAYTHGRTKTSFVAVAPRVPQRTELGGRGDTYTAASTDSIAKAKKIKLNRCLCP